MCSVALTVNFEIEGIELFEAPTPYQRCSLLIQNYLSSRSKTRAFASYWHSVSSTLSTTMTFGHILINFGSLLFLTSMPPLKRTKNSCWLVGCFQTGGFITNLCTYTMRSEISYLNRKLEVRKIFLLNE